MKTTPWQRDAITAYFESQSQGATVTHLERVASERVAGTVHDIWDVHSSDGRWWIVSNPMNLYPQNDFKSVDVVLTFHVGLTARIATRFEVPITEDAAMLLPGSWRRWEQAVEALSRAAEAEDFQAVGMRLRECLVSFAGEVASHDLVPPGETAPQAANVVAWSELLADRLAAGSSAARLRSYLKNMSQETWGYVNWLTHARNAGSLDAEIGTSAVSHLLATFTAAGLRLSRSTDERCAECDSHAMSAGRCQQCGWLDPEHEPAALPEINEKEQAARLAEPCTPSSDISTLITPGEYRKG